MSGIPSWDDAVLNAIDRPKPCPPTPTAGCQRS
ncbi:MAG: TonB C-terminal domain-containing protein [Burkholderiales bacterium]|nr:TonB C-terminal domain-containing protein [Burkholderiales bacterium]